MTFYLEDDNFLDSPRMISLGLEDDELGMLQCALRHSNRHLTDGSVHKRILLLRISRSLEANPSSLLQARKQTLSNLLDLGVFAELPDGIIQIVGYLDSFQSKNQVEEKRKNISEIRAKNGHAGGVASGLVRAVEARAKQKEATSKQNEASPLLSSPLHTTPVLERSETSERATASGAAPEPGLGAQAAHPVRLVGLVEKIPFGLAGFHAGIGQELKGKGLPPDARRAARHMHEMLYFSVEMAKGPIDVTDSSMSDYSFSLRVLEKYELMSRDDLQQAKRLLGSFLAMNERYNQQKGTA